MWHLIPKPKNYWHGVFEEFLKISPIGIETNFFEQGGDSLIAIKILTKLSSDFKIDISMKDIFSFPTIHLLSDFIDCHVTKKKALHLTLKKAPLQDSYCLSSAQKRIFYTMQSNPSSVAYNTPGGILFDRVPSLKKLQKAIDSIIARHESFRTYFVVENEEVKQKILADYHFSLSYEKANYADLGNLFQAFLQPFDLSKPPLFRAKLVEFENQKAILFMDFHHIICDGSSSRIFMEELSQLYKGISLTKNTFDYKDYALWEKNYFTSDRFKQDEIYWVSKFADQEPPVLAMPTNFSRPSVFSFDGNKLSCEISNKNRLYDLCNQFHTTPFLFMLSVYYVLLYKYTNQEELVVGTPVFDRNLKDVENMIGMFVNTLALKNKVDPSKTFVEFVQFVTTNCLEDFQHSSYPFDGLIEHLKVPKDVSRNNPLFDTMFVFQNEGNPVLHFDGFNGSYYIPDNQTSKFDFLLEVIPETNDLKLNLEYYNKIYTKDFMLDFLKHYVAILDFVLANPNTSLKDISILSNLEKKELLTIYENHVLPYPYDKSIIRLWEEQVSKTPNSIAVWYQDEKISYQELKDKVDNFSYYLHKRGVKKGDMVGTLLDRSSHLIIAMLAILKCGAVYLPIDRSFPEARISYILQNSKLKTLIINGSSYKDFANIDVVKMNDSLLEQGFSWEGVKTFPDDSIYSIYTSGSTGNPKGVLVTNQNLNHFIHCFKELFGNTVNKKDICLASTNIGFDVSIWEFFFSLLNGATLCLYPKNTIEDIFDFCEVLMDYKITLCYLPPNILNEVYTILSQNKKRVKLEKILVGVEPIKTSTILKYYDLNPSIRIVNGYGPTETTICCTAFVVTPSNLKSFDVIPIGKPLFNLNAYLLDKDLNLLPKGIPGELYIEGDNVTKGYLHQPKLTKDKYIPSPFNRDKRLYATGDIVKMLPDGTLSFVGRNDSQVKINGHRLELSEITNHVLSYPGISNCSVLVKEQKGHKIMVAYFTADKKVVLNDLRSFLLLKLPFYAVPNRFVQLDKFVLTSNGKVDKKFLEGIALTDEVTYEAPRNHFEKELVRLWQELLNIDKIGITDNFFDLGGDSLLAIRLQIQAFKLGLAISYADIFANPTIKQLSQKVAVTKDSKVDLGDYDYKEMNALLAKNNLPIKKAPQLASLKNVLLTGSTGFIGVHILDKLLSDTQATIYCLVRSKDNVSYMNRLSKMMQFYFGHRYDAFLGNRIQMIQGDITSERLGLSYEDYEKIGRKLSCVINSAAIVKHYGKSEDFGRTNIDGVSHVVDFCKDFSIPLYHLSTLSVSRQCLF